MLSEPILSVDRVAKVYRIFPRPWDRIRELVTGRSHHQPVRALRSLLRQSSLGGESAADSPIAAICASLD